MRPPAVSRSLYRVLIAPRAAEEGDRRRELALNGLVVALIALAIVPAVQRAIQISEGGVDSADHLKTLVILLCGAICLMLLLALSRRGRPVEAAWGLLAVLYLLGLWFAVAEGASKNVTIVVWMLLVVSAAVLCSPRAAVGTAGMITLSVITVSGLESAGVLGVPSEVGSPESDFLIALEMGAAFLAIALLLAARTLEYSQSVGELVGGSSTSSVHELRTSLLTVREIQVVKLLALGRSDAVISQELFVSLRTVHSHVSNALRKTGCANRTELAVLAVKEGLVEPG